LPENPSVVVSLRGLGHVPSFKNSKMIIPVWRIGKNGQKYRCPTLIAKPERQKWMKAAIQLMTSQLQSESRTAVAGTSTAICLQSLTAWSKQFDDSHQWMPRILIQVKTVDKGQEGADITISLCERR
jgi:hypothetical protein